MVRPAEEGDEYEVKDQAYTGPGIIINSEFLNGLSVPEKSINETIRVLEDKKLGKKKSITD